MKLNEIQTTFIYSNGSLVNKVDRNYNSLKGQPGHHRRKDGYKGVRFKGKQYLEHRLIWRLLKGKMEEGMEIDHINMIRHDNRIENLRLVSKSDNLINNKAKGYTRDPDSGGYTVRIKRNHVSKYIGRYETKVEAHKAYLKEKETFHVIQ